MGVMVGGRPKKDSESLEVRGAVKLREESVFILSLRMGIGVSRSESLIWDGCYSLGVLYMVYNESSSEGELDILDRFLILEVFSPTMDLVGLSVIVLLSAVADEDVPGKDVGGKLSDLLFPNLSGTTDLMFCEVERTDFAMVDLIILAKEVLLNCILLDCCALSGLNGILVLSLVFCCIFVG